MDILLSKYGLIFTEFESIDLGSASVNTVKFSKYQTIFILSKKYIIVYYTWLIKKTLKIEAKARYFVDYLFIVLEHFVKLFAVIIDINNDLLYAAPASLICVTVFTCIGRGTITGSFNGVYVYTPELFPTTLRWVLCKMFRVGPHAGSFNGVYVYTPELFPITLRRVLWNMDRVGPHTGSLNSVYVFTLELFPTTLRWVLCHVYRVGPHTGSFNGVYVYTPELFPTTLRWVLCNL